MNKRSRYTALLIILFIALPVLIHAGDLKKSRGAFPEMAIIRLSNGPNHVDINGDGRDDLIFVAWYENYNAHSYSLFNFYMNLPDGDQPEKQWHTVPFLDDKGMPGKDTITTQEGADCILQDIRVLRSASQKNIPVIIVMGKRDSGNSFADAAAVKFIVFELEQNTEGSIGEPPFYFKQKKVIKGRKEYCDINEAFSKELGID